MDRNFMINIFLHGLIIRYVIKDMHMFLTTVWSGYKMQIKTAISLQF